MRYGKGLLSLLFFLAMVVIGMLLFNDKASADVDFVIEDGVLVDYKGNDAVVVIPDGVTCIGWGAFADCSNLTNITIPSGVTSIEGYAFAHCSNLVNITIPSSVTSIGWLAFSGTKWLSVKQEENPLVIVNHILIDGTTCKGNVTVPNNVTSIQMYAFEGCDMTSVTIPSSVTGIGDNAFYRCKALVSIHVSLDNENYCSDSGVLFDKNKRILYAYPLGKKDANYSLPNDVTSIANCAFFGCENLISIMIPSGLVSIERQAFYQCVNLASITIPSSVTNIEYLAFYGTKWLSLKQEENPLVIVNNILIDGTACAGSVEIPSNVTAISGFSFFFCDGLTSITLPPGVTSIGGRAFEECSNLKSITIPDSVTSIGVEVFVGCSKDLTIYCGINSFAHQYAIENGISYLLASGGSEEPDPMEPPEPSESLEPLESPNSLETPKPKESLGPSESPKPTDSPATTNQGEINNIPVSGITLKEQFKTLDINKSFTIEPTIAPSNATNNEVSYRSSNTKIATVNGKGVVTARKSGRAVITITAKDGSKVTAKCTITVRPAVPKGVNIKKKGKTSISISWKKVLDATGYEVYTSTKKNKGFVRVAMVKGFTKVNDTNKGLKKRRTYYYKVRSYKTINNKKVYGGYSVVKKIKL